LAPFFGAAVLAFFWLLGAACFRVAPFFAGPGVGATCAPCSAMFAVPEVAAVSTFFVFMLVYPFAVKSAVRIFITLAANTRKVKDGKRLREANDWR
jgi:hypothetical protein